MTTKARDIATLVELFAASDWDELHVEADGIQVFLSKDPNAQLTSPGADPRPASRERSADPPSAKKASPARPRTHEPVAADDIPSTWIAITAPNLGTFYRAPKPGAAPLVEEGQSVQPDTELCLLEVMKLFTTVKAGLTGVVRRICVADGQMVEFDQVLFYIERT